MIYKKIIDALQAHDIATCEILVSQIHTLSPVEKNDLLLQAIHSEFYESLDLLINADCLINIDDFFETTPLYEASKSGNLFIAKQLIAAGAQVNCALKNGELPIRTAVAEGQTAIVQLLLNNGSRIEKTSKDSDDCSLLELSATQGNTDILKLLIRAGFPLKDREKIDSAIEKSINNSQVEAVQLLVLSGAKPSGYHLYLAVKGNHFDLLDLFLEHGANPNIIIPKKGSPLYAAAGAPNPKEDMIESLIMAGAKVSLKTAGGLTPYKATTSSVREKMRSWKKTYLQKRKIQKAFYQNAFSMFCERLSSRLLKSNTFFAKLPIEIIEQILMFSAQEHFKSFPFLKEYDLLPLIKKANLAAERSVSQYESSPSPTMNTKGYTPLAEAQQSATTQVLNTATSSPAKKPSPT